MTPLCLRARRDQRSLADTAIIASGAGRHSHPGLAESTFAGTVLRLHTPWGIVCVETTSLRENACQQRSSTSRRVTGSPAVRPEGSAPEERSCRLHPGTRSVAPAGSWTMSDALAAVSAYGYVPWERSWSASTLRRHHERQQPRDHRRSLRPGDRDGMRVRWLRPVLVSGGDHLDSPSRDRAPLGRSGRGPVSRHWQAGGPGRAQGRGPGDPRR